VRLVLAFLLLSSAAYADDLTLDQAIALYREHSPRLAASRAAVGVAAADVVEARIYPNPEVGLNTARNVHGDTAGPQSQYQLDLSIPVLIGHQRGRREDAAHAHVAATQREVEADQAQTELDIVDKFEALVVAQERAQNLTTAFEDTRKVRDIVAGRSTAGATSAYAVERIDLELASLSSRVDDAHVTEQAASSVLAIAIGMPALPIHAQGTLDVAATPALDGAHPLLATLRADLAAARADETRARADAVPTPSLALSAFTTDGPQGVAVIAGVTVPLPLFDRNQGAVARARAEARKSELELEATANALGGELARATKEVTQRRESLARYQGDAMHRLEKVREMAEASFKNGQGGIVELLDALTAITDAKLQELELRQGVANAVLAVRRASKGR
jgi:cobalt-zinc-cadmium efflux system outer membrane protein